MTIGLFSSLTPKVCPTICNYANFAKSQTHKDFTPVCTTELGAFAKLEPEFTKRGTKLIGLSANTVKSHGEWIKDIDEIAETSLSFPIIGDKDRKISYAYDM